MTKEPESAPRHTEEDERGVTILRGGEVLPPEGKEAPSPKQDAPLPDTPGQTEEATGLSNSPGWLSDLLSSPEDQREEGEEQRATEEPGSSSLLAPLQERAMGNGEWAMGEVRGDRDLAVADEKSAPLAVLVKEESALAPLPRAALDDPSPTECGRGRQA